MTVRTAPALAGLKNAHVGDPGALVAETHRLGTGGLFVAATGLHAAAGVLPAPTGYMGAATLTSPTSLQVDPARWVVPGTRTASQGDYLVVNDAPATLAVPVQNSTQSRKGLAVVYVTDSEYNVGDDDRAHLEVIPGALSSGTAVVPATPANALVLGTVTIPAVGGGSVTYTPATVPYAVTVGGVRPRTSAGAPSTPGGYDRQLAIDTAGVVYAWNAAGNTWDLLPYLASGARGVANGVASLGSGGTVPTTQLPIAVPGGVAGLDGSALVPVSELPVGVANGVAGLGADGKVPAGQLPSLSIPAVVRVSTWTLRNLASTSWSAITWAASLGRFVAVNQSSTAASSAATSPDGINWTLRAMPSGLAWTGVAWSPTLNLFVAVTQSSGAGGVATSPDGITWTARTWPATAAAAAVIWVPALSLFVGVGSGTSRVVTSPDGINWTGRTVPNAYNWSAVAWSSSLGLLVAVCTDNVGNSVMTSPDGINWTARTTPAGVMRSIAWSPALSLFVAVGNSVTGGQAKMMTSPDGINWTVRSATIPDTTHALWSVEWSPELSIFVAVGSASGANALGLLTVVTSPDGINWTPRNGPYNGGGTWQAIAWASSLGLFAAVGPSNNSMSVMTSAV